MKRKIIQGLLCVGMLLPVVGIADVIYGENDSVEKTKFYTVNDKRVDNKAIVGDGVIKATSVCDDENVIVRIDVVAQTNRYHIPTDCGITDYEGSEYKTPVELEEAVPVDDKYDVMGVDSIYSMYFKSDNGETRGRQHIIVPVVR